MHLFRDPQRPWYEPAQGNHDQRRKFPADKIYQGEQWDSPHIAARALEEKKFTTGQQALFERFDEGDRRKAIADGLAELEVGINGFDAVFVEF